MSFLRKLEGPLLTIMRIVVGLLFACYAAFVASGEMAVAYFTAHQPRGGLPIENAGELAVFFSFVFLYLAARGPGPATVAGALSRPDLA